MQTHLADFIRNTPEGREADAILRSCVHCGFCLATCPTYRLLGDELDSPRGRIYLIKQVLEGEPAGAATRLHLDRCLTCRSCETTCPSGVQYGHLLDIGRSLVERGARRGRVERWQRALLRLVLPRAALFNPLLKLAQALRPFLPGGLRRAVPRRALPSSWPATQHARRMLLLDGCVQPGLAPNINAAAARVLDRLGISLVRAPRAGCCGALSYHLNAQEEGLDTMRRNIDAWWPHIENGAEAVVATASGCGVTVKEYGHLLRFDPLYAEKAARVSAAARDISEILAAEKDRLAGLLHSSPEGDKRDAKLAFHAPCTLQHGQKITGVAEEMLELAGFQLTEVPDAHLCCGSAGAYSMLQKGISGQLRADRIAALESGGPASIATANIGCLMHLRQGTQRPVRHWVELLDERLIPLPNRM
jgi:glycolate oxidase iron-sulfur subunit